MNWSTCMICQETSQEPLRCPLNNKNSNVDKTAQYQKLVNNIAKYKEHDYLPTAIKFDENISVENNL